MADPVADPREAGPPGGGLAGDLAPMVRLRSLTVEYAIEGRRILALDGVDLTAAPGEVVGLMGPSGSGKSTLIQTIGGLKTPTRGDVQVDGLSLSRLTDAELARFRNQNIGFVFQLFQLLPDVTALENVELPLVLAGVEPGERRRRARESLKTVGLEERAAHRPGQLSGGEMQRVAIARALVNQPRLVLADEPTGNLDPASAAHVMELLVSLRERFGVTVIVVTHEAGVAAYTDRVVRLERGGLA